MTVDVAIVGAGVSGLATAFALTRRGHRVLVLERQVHAGGNAVSERIGGFLMEHGPTSVNAARPGAAALSTRLGLDGLRCEPGSAVRHRYLVGRGALRRIPVHPLGILTSGYLSPAARLRLLAEPFVPAAPGGGEETVAEFCTRRFGRAFADGVIDPLVGGLFAGRASDLSLPSVFPCLQEMEDRHGSIVRALLARRAGRTAMPGRRLYSWQDGIATLPRALAKRLGASVRTGIAVRRIRPGPQGFRLDAGAAGSVEARAVVVATQPHVAAGLIEDLDPAGAAAAGGIDAPPLAVAFLGYRRRQVDHPLDGIGFLAPTREDRSLLGALFCSTMFPGRAPEGHVSLAGYVGGARAPWLASLAPGDVIALARAEFGDLVGARGEPVVARVRQWARGLPQYHIGHGARVADLRAIEERRPGLFVTGNYLDGPSVGNCVAQACDVARRIDSFLPRRARRAGARRPAAAGWGAVGVRRYGVGRGGAPGHPRRETRGPVVRKCATAAQPRVAKTRGKPGFMDWAYPSPWGRQSSRVVSSTAAPARSPPGTPRCATVARMTGWISSFVALPRHRPPGAATGPRPAGRPPAAR